MCVHGGVCVLELVFALAEQTGLAGEGKRVLVAGSMCWS